MDLKKIYHLFEVGGKKNQEDFIWPLPGVATSSDNIFIVCDGVGGSDNGEVASRLISESIGKALFKTPEDDITAAHINTLLTVAREELVHYAVSNGLNPDMATTFTLLVLLNKKALISWCGDSRVYHIHNGEVAFKTADHSLVNSLVKSGEISEEEAADHPQKNIILRAIKADSPVVDAEFHLIEEVHDGDYFMLCTDGLLENITDRELCSLLRQNDKESIDLVDEFQKRCAGRTRDNYSMYLIKVQQQEKPVSSRRNVVTLSLIVLLFISASAFILSRYYGKSPVPETKAAISTPPHPVDIIPERPALFHQDHKEQGLLVKAEGHTDKSPVLKAVVPKGDDPVIAEPQKRNTAETAEKVSEKIPVKDTIIDP